MPQPTGHLKRTLGLFPSTAIVIGSVVGSGIFISTSGMAKVLPSAPLLLLMWVIGGIMTLFGALSVCELASQMPKTGGPFEFLREIYGDKTAFFYGWANFMIAGTGGVAGVAFLFAHYLGEFIPLYHLAPEVEKIAVAIPFLGEIFPFADIGVKIIAALLVVALSFTNALGVEVGATLQSYSTTLKIGLILGIVGIVFIGGHQLGSVENYFQAATPQAALTGWALPTACFAALASAFWAYDGWGNLMYIAGEVKEPGKTVPRATLLAIAVVLSLYFIVNLAYLYLIPVDQAGSVPGGRIASAAVSLVLGKAGGLVVSALIVFSAFDCTNASILTYARLYYAMGTKGDFAKSAGRIHAKYSTPHYALLYQCLWVLVLLFSGSFELITSMYVFVNWVFYFLMVVGVFVVRRRNKRSGIQASFHLPGYPWVPLTFVIFSVLYIVMTLVGDVRAYLSGAEPLIKSVTGLVLVALGLPFYLFWKKQKSSAA